MKQVRNSPVKFWLILALAAISASSLFASSDGAVDVHTTPLLLLGSPQSGKATVRSTNTTYVVGQYALINGLTYFALTAGLPGAVVTVTNTLADFTDGAVVWRKVMPNSRKGFTIVNASTNLIWLSDQPFTGVSGVQLAANGGSWSVSGVETPQGPIWCRAAHTNSSVLTFEW